MYGEQHPPRKGELKNVDGRDVQLSPGMVAAVEVKTGTRRLTPLMRIIDALVAKTAIEQMTNSMSEANGDERT
jgi:hypothetical protein